MKPSKPVRVSLFHSKEVCGVISYLPEIYDIRISSLFPKWRRHIALIHELLHLADHEMARRTDHYDLHIKAVWLFVCFNSDEDPSCLSMAVKLPNIQIEEQIMIKNLYDENRQIINSTDVDYDVVTTAKGVLTNIEALLESVKTFFSMISRAKSIGKDTLGAVWEAVGPVFPGLAKLISVFSPIFTENTEKIDQVLGLKLKTQSQLSGVENQKPTHENPFKNLKEVEDAIKKFNSMPIISLEDLKGKTLKQAQTHMADKVRLGNEILARAKGIAGVDQLLSSGFKALFSTSQNRFNEINQKVGTSDSASELFDCDIDSLFHL